MNKETLIKAVKDLCLDALFTDGAHHKQWYFEKVLETIGFDLDNLRKEIRMLGFDPPEKGIAP